MRAAAKEKWLEAHGIEHWTHFYTDYGRLLQKRFFDYFLKGEKNGWDRQPKVQLQVRHVDRFVERHESEWPIARTQWTKFYLHPAAHTLEPAPANAAGAIYDATDTVLVVEEQGASSLSLDRLETTFPAPLGSTTTFSSACWRGGMMLGTSSSSLNFAPQRRRRRGPTCTLAPFPPPGTHHSTSRTFRPGVALNVTSANAGTLVAQLPLPEQLRFASGS